MTGSALGRTSLCLSDTRLRVASRTRRYGVGRHPMEPRLHIPGGRLHRLPSRLAVAAPAIRSECGSMRVAVAPPAAPGNVRSHRAPVIVTSETGGASMGRFKAIPSLLLVIEGEVSSHNFPTLSKVADSAVARKRLVRRDRALLQIPTVPRRTQAATEDDQDGRRNERPCKNQSRFPNSTHGSPGIAQAQLDQRRIHVVALEVRGPAEQVPPARDTSVEAYGQIAQ